jgi:hypothetical protein
VKQLRATIPVAAIHRRNGYLSGAAKALLTLVSGAPITLRRASAASRSRHKRAARRKPG